MNARKYLISITILILILAKSCLFKSFEFTEKSNSVNSSEETSSTDEETVIEENFIVLEKEATKIGNKLENLILDVVKQFLKSPKKNPINKHGRSFRTESTTSITEGRLETTLENTEDVTSLSNQEDVLHIRRKRTPYDPPSRYEEMPNARMNEESSMRQASTWDKRGCNDKSEREGMLEKQHIEDLKYEVKKLHGMVEMLRDQQRIIKILNEENKNTRGKSGDNTKTNDMLKVLHKLNDSKQKDKQAQGIYDADNSQNDNEPTKTHQELEILKRQIQQAVINLNKTREIITLENLKEADLERELDNQRNDIKWLKLMINQILNKKEQASVHQNTTFYRNVGENTSNKTAEIVGSYLTLPNFLQHVPNSSTSSPNKNLTPTHSKIPQSRASGNSENDSDEREVKRRLKTVMQDVPNARESEFSEIEKLLDKVNNKGKTLDDSEDIQSKLLQIEGELKKQKENDDMTKAVRLLQKKLKKIKPAAETKGLDDDGDVLSQLLKLQKAMKKIEKPQSKVDDLEVEEQLKALQKEINSLRPDDDLDFDDTEGKITGDTGLQIMLNKLIGGSKGPSLSPQQLIALRKMMSQNQPFGGRPDLYQGNYKQIFYPISDLGPSSYAPNYGPYGNQYGLPNNVPSGKYGPYNGNGIDYSGNGDYRNNIGYIKNGYQDYSKTTGYNSNGDHSNMGYNAPYGNPTNNYPGSNTVNSYKPNAYPGQNPYPSPNSYPNPNSYYAQNAPGSYQNPPYSNTKPNAYEQNQQNIAGSYPNSAHSGTKPNVYEADNQPYQPSNNFFLASPAAKTYPNSPQPAYSPPKPNEAANSEKFYSHSSQTASPAYSSYSNDKVEDLKTQIYSLQDAISSLNRPEYSQTTEDKNTIYNLEQQINELKSVVSSLNHENYVPSGGDHLSESANVYDTAPNSYSSQNNQKTQGNGYDSRTRSRRSIENNNLDDQSPAKALDTIGTFLKNNLLNEQENTPEQEANSLTRSANFADLSKQLNELKKQLDRHVPRTQLYRANFGTPALNVDTYQRAPYDPYAVSPYKMESKQSKKIDIFTSIVDKIMDKVVASIPIVVKKLFGFALNELGSGDDYNGYGGMQNVFKKMGIFGFLPLIIMKLLNSLSAFVEVLQKNKFLKTFLIPALVVLIAGGSIIFLIWWLQPNDDQHYDNPYADNHNYAMNYGDSYKNSHEQGIIRSYLGSNRVSNNDFRPPLNYYGTYNPQFGRTNNNRFMYTNNLIND